MKKQEVHKPTAKQIATYMQRTGETNIEQAFHACLKRKNIQRVDLTGRRISIHPFAKLDLSKALETLGWPDAEANRLASQAISAVCTEIVNLNGIPFQGGISRKCTLTTLCATLREQTSEEHELQWLLIRSATNQGKDVDHE